MNSNIPTFIKLVALYEPIKLVPMHSWFQFNDYPYARIERFSTTLNKGIVAVSEYDCVDKIYFSSWRQAMIWICKQAKRISEYEVQDTDYIVDSGHYRYRVYFNKFQE